MDLEGVLKKCVRFYMNSALPRGTFPHLARLTGTLDRGQKTP